MARRSRRALGLAMLLGTGLLAGEGTERQPPALVFPAEGFSIRGFEGIAGARSAEASYQVASFFLRPVSGIQPNVNVQIQVHRGSIDDYMDLSRTGFEEAGFSEVETRRLDDDRCSFEYRGVVQGNLFHFYAVALRQPGRILLATGTALDSHWDDYEQLLRASVDSLRSLPGD